MYESDDKMVSHPSHYQSKSGLEVIDVIEAFTEDLSGMEAVDTANVIKYICRWKKKGGVQDLKKVIWYATDLIDRIEGRTDDQDEDVTGFLRYGRYNNENEAWHELMEIVKVATNTGAAYVKVGDSKIPLRVSDLNHSYTARNEDDTFSIMLSLP